MRRRWILEQAWHLPLLIFPIVTPANDIFESDNSDSDLDFEGETDGKNILSDYLTTGKLPIKMHGVDIYPQSYHVHNHTWSEYSDEPCSRSLHDP